VSGAFAGLKEVTAAGAGSAQAPASLLDKDLSSQLRVRGRVKALNVNVHQGLHGEGFIYALACACGFTCSKPSLDVDGIDWQIAHPGPKGTTRSPKIEVQVKTTSRPERGDGLFHYRIAVRSYNKLAGPGFQVPRYLALVVVPPTAGQYAICSTDHMLLGTAAYWVSLADEKEEPTGEHDPQSILVRIPERNLLTMRTLDALLAGDLEGAAT